MCIVNFIETKTFPMCISLKNERTKAGMDAQQLLAAIVNKQLK